MEELGSVMEELIDLQTVQVQEKKDEIVLPEDGTSLTLLQKVYRSSAIPLTTRMRAATAALPHEHPKLAVTANFQVGDFADQLEQAIERSRKVTTMIEAKPVKAIEDKPTTDVKLKPSVADRRYRRW
jgi:hypothetical protein